MSQVFHEVDVFASIIIVGFPNSLLITYLSIKESMKHVGSCQIPKLIHHTAFPTVTSPEDVLSATP